MPNPLNSQAIVTALLLPVLLITAAFVANLNDMSLSDVVVQLGIIASLLGGGAVAWTNVYSKKTVDRIVDTKTKEGRVEGAAFEARARDEQEAQHADLWQERESFAAEDY